MKNKYSEKIIKEIMAYSKENAISQWRVQNRMGKDEIVSEITPDNLNGVMRAMFKGDNQLAIRVLPWVELGSIVNIITIISRYKDYLAQNADVMKKILSTNEAKLQTFSGQKKKLYNALKELYSAPVFKELVEEFFKDIDDAQNYQVKELSTCTFGFDLTRFVDSYPANYDFYQIEDRFVHFINYLQGSPEVLEKLGVKAITHINGEDDYIYVMMLEPQNRDKVKFFLSELLEQFPRFDLSMAGQQNNEVKNIFIDSILLAYTIPNNEEGGERGSSEKEGKNETGAAKNKANKI